MSICSKLICGICANNKMNRADSLCGKCVAFDEFESDIDLIDEELTNAMEAEQTLHGRIQRGIQENNNLRTKLETSEAEVKELKVLCRDLPEMFFKVLESEFPCGGLALSIDDCNTCGFIDDDSQCKFHNVLETLKAAGGNNA